MAERDSATQWGRRFHEAPDAKARLVCLPHAGGAASFFFPVSRGVPAEVDVLSVQYPGRQDRRHERFIDTVDELADRIFETVLPLTDLPVTLFGHSMGATVAFEVARRCESAGVALSGLFVSGRAAPSRSRNEWVHLRDDEGLTAEMKALSGTEAQLLGDDEMLQAILPALRNDYKALESYVYRPGPVLTCPVVAMIGDDDPKSTIDEARAWQEHTTGPFELQIYSGGHFYINVYSSTVTNVLSEHILSAL